MKAVSDWLVVRNEHKNILLLHCQFGFFALVVLNNSAWASGITPASLHCKRKHQEQCYFPKKLCSQGNYAGDFSCFGVGDSHTCRLGCFSLKAAWSDTYWLNRMLCWGHIPNLCRMESMWVWMSRPPTSTVPDVGGKRPVSIDLGKQNEETPLLLSLC